MPNSSSRNLFHKLFFISAFFSLVSCGSSDGSSENGDGCSTKNVVSSLKYDDAEQEFNLEYTYANFNSTYKTYRVLFLTYPKAKDNDSGKKGPDQQRLVVGIMNPSGGEFKPGKYTLSGDEKGFNKAFVQVETESGIKMCNIAGIEDPGYIEILAVSETHICGKFNLNGTDFHAEGEFNTKHEAVK